jgi:hypothetical protein
MAGGFAILIPTLRRVERVIGLASARLCKSQPIRIAGAIGIADAEYRPRLLDRSGRRQQVTA